jgi:predicted dehydrogenase
MGDEIMGTTLAIVGLKGHQYVVLEALRGLPEVEIVAVADDEPESLKEVSRFAGATPDTGTYAGYRELLANHKPDIVLEAGNDRDRAEVLVACAERGIHLISEKPLAYDLPSLDRVREAVTRSGVTMTSLLTMRLEPAYVALRQAVAEGAVGTITQAGAQKSYRLGERPAWQKSRKTFSGIIPFIGIHAVDLIRWCGGREFVEVMAYSGNVGHPEMGELEDSGCMVARLDNGAPAAIRVDYCRPAAAPSHGDDRLRIAGSAGVIEAMQGKVTLITSDAGPQELPLPEEVEFLPDFLESIRTGREPYIPFVECARSTEVVLRAREAAESGRVVRM